MAAFVPSGAGIVGGCCGTTPAFIAALAAGFGAVISEVGAVMMKDMVDGGMMDTRQVFVGLLVMSLFVPCMSNTLIMGRVIGRRRTLLVFVAVTVIALLTGLAVNGVWTRVPH